LRFAYRYSCLVGFSTNDRCSVDLKFDLPDAVGDAILDVTGPILTIICH
jgi:hypothetical protein